METRSVTFIETPPHLHPPLQDLVPPLWDLGDDTLDKDYISYDDFLLHVRDYTGVLDFISVLNCTANNLYNLKERQCRVDRSASPGVSRSNPRSHQERFAHARSTFAWSRITSGMFARSSRGAFVRRGITAEWRGSLTRNRGTFAGPRADYSKKRDRYAQQHDSSA